MMSHIGLVMLILWRDLIDRSFPKTTIFSISSWLYRERIPSIYGRLVPWVFRGRRCPQLLQEAFGFTSSSFQGLEMLILPTLPRIMRGSSSPRRPDDRKSDS